MYRLYYENVTCANDGVTLEILPTVHQNQKLWTVSDFSSTHQKNETKPSFGVTFFDQIAILKAATDA